MGSTRTSKTGAPGLHLSREYEVDTRPPSAGRLISVTANPTRLAERDLLGKTCWNVFEHRAQPCDGCPVFGAGSAAFGVLSEADGVYRVVRVHRHQTRAEVDVCTLEHPPVVALIQEKFRRLAKVARLSEREGRVFSLVSRGKSSKEIAAEIGISERTAKFHVSNLLRKLGAESRMDVLRLLLAPTKDLPLPQSPRRPQRRGGSRAGT